MICQIYKKLTKLYGENDAILELKLENAVLQQKPKKINNILKKLKNYSYASVNINLPDHLPTAHYSERLISRKVKSSQIINSYHKFYIAYQKGDEICCYLLINRKLYKLIINPEKKLLITIFRR